MQDYLAQFGPLIAHSQAVHFVYHVAERHVLYVSEAYARVFGDPTAHVNDDLPYLLQRVHPDDQAYLQEQLAQAAPNQVLEDLELRLIRPDGGTQWLALTVCRGQLPDGAPSLSGWVRDITPQKEVAINAEKFNTKKDATLEILAHDLAAPLHLLLQLTSFMREAVGTPTNPQVPELLQLMTRTCQRSVDLIHDFVDNEFMESVDVALKRERRDVVPWLGALLEEYQQSGQHTTLHFNYTPAEQPIYVDMDVNKFQQAVNNLISNAVKFTPDGGRISVGVERQDSSAIITITDTGVGIPERLLPVLFDKFTKARRPGLRGERSVGLGMSIIQTIVGLHQGHIQVHTTEGQGTTFTIQLPVLPA